MIGWFALNVPSGLSLYYFANTVFTTAQQIYLKKLGGGLLACCTPDCCCAQLAGSHSKSTWEWNQGQAPPALSWEADCPVPQTPLDKVASALLLPINKLI